MTTVIINGKEYIPADTPTFILIVDHDGDYDVADLHGPFPTMAAAKVYAERLRGTLGLPREATPENNEVWTDLGWYFGIFQPKKTV